MQPPFGKPSLMRMGELIVAFLNLALAFWLALVLTVTVGLLFNPGLLGTWIFALAAVVGWLAAVRGVREARRAAEDAVGGLWGTYGRLILNRATWLIVALVAGPAIVMTIQPRRGPSHLGRLTTCKSNLKNIGTAMEMYSTDFKGLYPPSPDLLTPNYLKTIPTCPEAGSATYEFKVAAQPDAYTVICAGDHHGMVEVRANYPQYNSFTGLVER